MCYFLLLHKTNSNVQITQYLSIVVSPSSSSLKFRTNVHRIIIISNNKLARRYIFSSSIQLSYLNLPNTKKRQSQNVPLRFVILFSSMSFELELNYNSKISHCNCRNKVPRDQCFKADRYPYARRNHFSLVIFMVLYNCPPICLNEYKQKIRIESNVLFNAISILLSLFLLRRLSSLCFRMCSLLFEENTNFLC